MDKIPLTNSLLHYSRGNLLLMASRPVEARKEFEAGIANPTNEQYLKLCQEGVARSLKTEDGSIARANAYMLSPDKAIVRSQYLP